MKEIKVVAAVIINNGEIFCVQRPEHKYDYISKKFEFPGGKIEEGESKIEALKRELNEELGLFAEIGKHLKTVEHTYPDFKLTMHSYMVHVKSKEIKLNEHISSIWLGIENLRSLDWAAADIPIVETLMSIEWKDL